MFYTTQIIYSQGYIYYIYTSATRKKKEIHEIDPFVVMDVLRGPYVCFVGCSSTVYISTYEELPINFRSLHCVAFATLLHITYVLV